MHSLDTRPNKLWQESFQYSPFAANQRQLTKYDKQRIRQTEEFQKALASTRVICSDGNWERMNISRGNTTLALDISVGRVYSRYFIRGLSLVETTRMSRFLPDLGQSMYVCDARTYVTNLENLSGPFPPQRLVSIIRENIYTHLRAERRDKFWQWVDSLKKNPENKSTVALDIETNTGYIVGVGTLPVTLDT